MCGSVTIGRDMFGIFEELMSCWPSIRQKNCIETSMDKTRPFSKGLLPTSTLQSLVWSFASLQDSQLVFANIWKRTWLLIHGTKPKTCHSQTFPNIWFSRGRWPSYLQTFSVYDRMVMTLVQGGIPMSCDLISALHSRRLFWIKSSSVPLWFRRPFMRSYNDFSNLYLLNISIYI